MLRRRNSSPSLLKALDCAAPALARPQPVVSDNHGCANEAARRSLSFCDEPSSGSATPVNTDSTTRAAGVQDGATDAAVPAAAGKQQEEQHRHRHNRSAPCGASPDPAVVSAPMPAGSVPLTPLLLPARPRKRSSSSGAQSSSCYAFAPSSPLTSPYQSAQLAHGDTPCPGSPHMAAFSRSCSSGRRSLGGSDTATTSSTPGASRHAAYAPLAHALHLASAGVAADAVAAATSHHADASPEAGPLSAAAVTITGACAHALLSEATACAAGLLSSLALLQGARSAQAAGQGALQARAEAAECEAHSLRKQLAEAYSHQAAAEAEWDSRERQLQLRIGELEAALQGQAQDCSRLQGELHDAQQRVRTLMLQQAAAHGGSSRLRRMTTANDPPLTAAAAAHHAGKAASACAACRGAAPSATAFAAAAGVAPGGLLAHLESELAETRSAAAAAQASEAAALKQAEALRRAHELAQQQLQGERTALGRSQRRVEQLAARLARRQADVMMAELFQDAGDLRLRSIMHTAADGGDITIGARVVPPPGAPHVPGTWQLSRGSLPDGTPICLKRCLFNQDGTPRPAGLPEAAPWPSFSDVSREPRAALGLGLLARRHGGLEGGQGVPFANPLLHVMIQETSPEDRQVHGFGFEIWLIYKWLPRGDMWDSHVAGAAAVAAAALEGAAPRQAQQPAPHQVGRSIVEVKRLLLQLLDALWVLHGCGLVLGDLKPENCGVDDEGNVVLFDLGGVVELEPGQERVNHSPAFTPRYASPEQQLPPGQCYTCKASDVYTWARSAESLLQPWLAAAAAGDSALLAQLAASGVLVLLERCKAADPACRPTAEEAYRALAAVPL